jgi:hypothetical protein
VHACLCAGGDEAGDDGAALLSATWRDTRRAVFERGALPQFRLRQFLFACQARLLLRLQRPTEVRPSSCLVSSGSPSAKNCYLRSSITVSLASLQWHLDT